MKGPKLYNMLPKEIKEFPMINPENKKYSESQFKRKLDTFLQTIPDQPNLSYEYTKRMEGISRTGDRTNSIIRLNLWLKTKGVFLWKDL